MNNKKEILNIKGPLEPIRTPINKYSMQEWRYDAKTRLEKCKNQCQIVENVIAECKNAQDIATEVTKTNKLATDHEFEGRLEDSQYLKDELVRHRKNVLLEVDALTTYKARLIDGLTALTQNAEEICSKCLHFREQRIGIDLTIDDVEKELRKELGMIKTTENVFQKTLNHTKEQIRILKSLLYYLDGDLKNKDESIHVDRQSLILRENNLNLTIYQGSLSLNPSTVTTGEWTQHTDEITATVMKEISNTKLLRHYIDDIIKVTIEDLNNQKNITDEAFRKRILETKETKAALEDQHSEVVKQANSMVENIEKLEKSVAEKESFIALAQTRLANRCHRPGLEMTKDQVEINLIHEINNLRDIVANLQQTFFKAQGTLRHLLQLQVQLEEDINIKANSLKIDDSDCMTIRQSLIYHAY